ncbi:MAG: toprim domain-containing protein [Thermoanaerobaculia bacterium]
MVEGYFDCLSLDFAGVPGVVASMGTSLTTGQAALLRKFARYVVIAYVGDEAGRNATLRAAPVLMAAGLSVGVIDVGKGEDPDTYIKSHGIEGFLELLGNASDVFDFALQRLAPNPSALSGREKSEKLDTISGLLAAVSDPVIRNDAAQRVANGLRLEFETVWSKVRGPVRTSVPEPKTREPISTTEKQILGAVVRGELDPTLAKQLREEFFEDSVCRTLYSAIKDRIFRAQPLDFSGIATDVKGEAELTLLSELALGDEVGDSNPSALEDSIRRMERRFLERRLKELTHHSEEAQREGDSVREQALLIEKMTVLEQLRTLK